jgi:hypothetical protein
VPRRRSRTATELAASTGAQFTDGDDRGGQFVREGVGVEVIEVVVATVFTSSL